MQREETAGRVARGGCVGCGPTHAAAEWRTHSCQPHCVTSTHTCDNLQGGSHTKHCRMLLAAFCCCCDRHSTHTHTRISSARHNDVEALAACMAPATHIVAYRDMEGRLLSKGLLLAAGSTRWLLSCRLARIRARKKGRRSAGFRPLLLHPGSRSGPPHNLLHSRFLAVPFCPLQRAAHLGRKGVPLATVSGE